MAQFIFEVSKMDQQQNQQQQQRQQKTETEIDLLQQLRHAFLSAKHELNNDLTKLAIKNLPILEDPGTIQIDHTSCQISLSQSTTNSDQKEYQQPSTSDNTLQQLEPLDLDV